MLILGLSINNFNVLSYSLQEIILEKYRAVLTRKKLQERDLFDLFLIKGSLEADIKKIVEKRIGVYLNKEINAEEFFPNNLKQENRIHEIYRDKAQNSG